MRLPLRTALMSLLLVFAANTATAQSSSVATDIIALDKQLNQYILAHDPASAAKLYDDEFVLSVSGGGRKVKADMLADIGNAAVVLTICETSDVQVRVRGNAAVLTGTLRQAGTVNGRAIDVTLKVTDTWVRVDGRWLLLAGHASLAK